MYSYWLKQEADKALFPDIEWNKPEQKSLAGKLGIIGGDKLGFVAVGDAYTTALDAGAGSVRVLLPDVLRKTIPATITDAHFAPTNPSGGLSKDARSDLLALGEWANGILLIGDAGRNSETAILYDNFIKDYQGQLTITRDAFDLYKQTLDIVVDREKTLLVVSFSQLQTLFKNVYYPKILTFSMQLQQLVEALHKFTITYPVTIVTFHQQQLIAAHGGRVVTMEWENPMAIWKGSVATRAATYLMWTPHKPVEAVSSSLL
jgi:NAD(P)H-hydrate repair Nnr-like enzyme with NAD(P)H-hydrate dehydratase domain